MNEISEKNILNALDYADKHGMDIDELVNQLAENGLRINDDQILLNILDKMVENGTVVKHEDVYINSNHIRKYDGRFS